MIYKRGDIIEVSNQWELYTSILGTVLEVEEAPIGYVSIRLFKSGYRGLYHEKYLRLICSPASMIEEFLL